MVVVLFALIAASSAVSFFSYRATEWLVTEDMNQALAKTMAEQQSDVINCDTITVFNSHLQMEELRGQAVLAVDTHQGFTLYPQVSSATILGLSDQRPAMVLWTAVLLWGLFCLYRRRPAIAGLYGGLAMRDGNIIDAQGCAIKLTPMQQQLMEMFMSAPDYTLTKQQICDALWPKKDDASETLYTLIRRLKPIIEQHSDLKIEVDRGRAYSLKAR